MALCPRNATAARRAPHKVHAGLPRRARCGLLLRLRGRPPALEQRGRSPSIHHPRDHAARATLGRWDAKASQRTRRPVSRASSGTSTGNPTRPKSPHSLGNARPTSTTLTGRLEARPHKVRPTWGGTVAETDQGPRVPATETRVRTPARSTPSGACSWGTCREARFLRGHSRRPHTSSGSVCRA